jgi:hypothetical protein
MPLFPVSPKTPRLSASFGAIWPLPDDVIGPSLQNSLTFGVANS